MNPFVLADGRWSVTGERVVVDLVNTDRRGRVSSSVLLSNGRTVGLVYREGIVCLVTGKGMRTFRLSGADFVRFTVDGVPFEVDAEQVTGFAPVS